MGLTLVPFGLLVLVLAVKDKDVVAGIFGLALMAFGFALWQIGNRHGWWEPDWMRWGRRDD